MIVYQRLGLPGDLFTDIGYSGAFIDFNFLPEAIRIS
jgi:hypothetical protein